MPTDRTALLALGAGVGSFVIGRLLSGGQGTETVAPATGDAATGARPPGDSAAAGLDFGDYGLGPGVLQGIDQGLGSGQSGGLPGGGEPTPPPAPAPTPTGLPPATTSSTYQVKINGRTPLYDKPGGKILGYVSLATYICTVPVSHWYKIIGPSTTANRGRYMPAEPWFTVTRLT